MPTHAFIFLKSTNQNGEIKEEILFTQNKDYPKGIMKSLILDYMSKSYYYTADKISHSF